MALSKKTWSKIGLVYASVIWGSTFFFVKDTLNHIDPVAMLMYRFALAAFVTAIIVILRKGNLWADFLRGGLLGVFLWLAFLFQTFGIMETSASNSGFITGLYVPLVPITAIFLFRKWPTLPQVVAIIMSVLGLWVLTGGIHSANRGDILTLGTAGLITFHILYSEKYVRGNRDPYVLSFQQFLVVALLSGIHLVLFNHSPHIENMKMVMSVSFLAFFATVSCILVQTIAQKHLDAVTVALLFTLEPVFAALFAWTLGGETFIPERTFGGFLIVFAMIVSEWKFKKKLLPI